MKEKCPKCGKDIEEKANFCSNCGYPLNQTKSEDQEIQGASETTEENGVTEKNSETPFTPEANESIEWSELKDMSLGHVMELFNEQNNDEIEKMPTEATNINELETSTEAVENTSAEPTQEPTTDLTTAALEDQPTEAPATEMLEKETVVFEDLPTAEKSSLETSSEATDAPKEEPSELTPNEMLQAYILAHKNDRAKQKSASENEGDLSAIAEASEPTPETEASAEILSKAAETEETTSETAAPADAKEVSAEKAEVKEDTFLKEPEAPASNKNKDISFELDEVPNFYAEAASETTTEPAQPSEIQPTQKKSYKKITFAAVAVMAVAVGGWAVYNGQQPTAEKKTTQTSGTSAKELADQIQTQINNYYLTEKKVFIKPEMISADTTKIKEKLEKIDDSKTATELSKQLEALDTKRDRIIAVNQLFDQAVIDGDKLSEANLAADQPIKLEKSQEKDSFNELMNQAIDQAQQQYNQLQKAKQAVATIYQNGQATAALTRAAYTTAKSEVDAVKSSALKKNLTTKLEQAEKVLVAAESAAQSAPQKNNAAPAASSNQVDANGYSAPNSEGVYTDPLYIADPKDVADTSNPAWSWNPGVKEKFIATAIGRGYIVEGGYRLEPAKIVNGEGYYNLYATNNQSPLLKGYPDGELHVYLVTVNAKTGWFKGNASRNAGR